MMRIVVLAGTAVNGVFPSHDVYNAIWEILLQQIAIWYNIDIGAIPEKNVRECNSLQGTLCLNDDILVFGKHKQNMINVFGKS